MNSAKFANGRLMRWAMFLQSYSFTVEAIKGSENVGADYLSRAEDLSLLTLNCPLFSNFSCLG